MIQIAARVDNRAQDHHVSLVTNGREQSISIAAKASGGGSSANGGEMLFLSLATCYCNDLYHEATRRDITVHSVEVEVLGEFDPAPGSIAEQVRYNVRVEAEASEDDILALIQHTDKVAEVQNTLRQGITVQLDRISASSTRRRGDS